MVIISNLIDRTVKKGAVVLLTSFVRIGKECLWLLEGQEKRTSGQELNKSVKECYKMMRKRGGRGRGCRDRNKDFSFPRIPVVFHSQLSLT